MPLTPQTTLSQTYKHAHCTGPQQWKGGDLSITPYRQACAPTRATKQKHKLNKPRQWSLHIHLLPHSSCQQDQKCSGSKAATPRRLHNNSNNNLQENAERRNQPPQPASKRMCAVCMCSHVTKQRQHHTLRAVVAATTTNPQTAHSTPAACQHQHHQQQQHQPLRHTASTQPAHTGIGSPVRQELDLKHNAWPSTSAAAAAAGPTTTQQPQSQGAPTS